MYFLTASYGVLEMLKHLAHKMLPDASVHMALGL